MTAPSVLLAAAIEFLLIDPCRYRLSRASSYRSARITSVGALSSKPICLNRAIENFFGSETLDRVSDA